MSERESVPRTLLIAAGVALTCSALVSGAVYWLRPIQLAYGAIERNFAILVAAGLADGDESLADRDIVSRYLELDPRLVDLESGLFTDADAAAATNYDYRAAIDDPELNVEIPRDLDVAGLGRRPRLMPVYLLNDGRILRRIVLPVYGRGMWSTIHGVVSIGPDLETIAGVRFYEHGETPGIGDRIESPAWVARWEGKRMYADDGTLALRVDAITGATVTVTAIDKLARYWFGDDGYGPFLANLRAGQ